MAVPAALATALARVREECSRQLCKNDIVDTVEWADEDPVVFPLGRGYVALIACATKGTTAIAGQTAGYRYPGYAVALKFGGSDRQWQGKGLFYPAEAGVDEVKRLVSEQLRDLMQRTPQ
jgi:hypothetical protein